MGMQPYGLFPMVLQPAGHPFPEPLFLTGVLPPPNIWFSEMEGERRRGLPFTEMPALDQHFIFHLCTNTVKQSFCLHDY